MNWVPATNSFHGGAMSSTPEYNHEYYLKNRTRVLARNKKWNAEHKEVMAKIERNWNIKVRKMNQIRIFFLN